MTTRTARLLLFVSVVAIISIGILIGWRLQHRTFPPLFAQKVPIVFTAHFFDIGQGDGMLFSDAHGNDVVVDGGPTDAMVSKIGQTLPASNRTIELMILTHPHSDHVTGLLWILRHYHVQKILLTKVSYPSATYRAFLEEIEKQHIQTEVVTSTEQFAVGDLHFSVLWPQISWEHRVVKDDAHAGMGGVNDTSIVLRLTTASTSLFLTGDASSAVEQQLLAAHLVASSTVLKVGHHGSKYSTDRKFLQALGAVDAVIQCAQKNDYGHPHLQTVRRLEEAHTKIFRNDMDGDVTLTVNASGTPQWVTER